MLAKKLRLKFAEVTILDRILIAEIKEGFLLDSSSNKELLDLGRKYFRESTYGYISNRVNSYAVDPMVYRDSAKVQNLKAIAVVSNSEIARANARRVERPFYRKGNAFDVFKNLEEAVIWIKQQL